MSKHEPSRDKKHTAVQIIRSFLARHPNTTGLALISPTTNVHIARLRHGLWAELAEAGLTSTEIGWLSGRDHTTVLYGIKRHTERQEVAA